MRLQDISQIAVIGLGRMGHGIAQSFAMGGYQVRGFDENSEARDTTLDRIRKNLNAMVASDLVAADQVDAILGRIEVVGSEADAAGDAQYVVEAIAEDLTAKQEFFNRIEDVVADSTIVASNSSSFTISQSGSGMRHRERAIVTHWFNPPHIVPTVEVVPGPTTTGEVAQTTVQLHKKIGKLAVRINKEIPGFLVNRVQVAMVREVWDLYERGVASAEDIDAAIQGSLGFRLALFGPLSVCDFGGINIWSTVYKALAPDLRSDAELPAKIQQLVDDGRAGANVGAGVFDYDSESMNDTLMERDKAMLQLAKLVHAK